MKRARVNGIGVGERVELQTSVRIVASTFAIARKTRKRFICQMFFFFFFFSCFVEGDIFEPRRVLKGRYFSFL